MAELKLEPIGIIHTPFKTVAETPRWGTITDELGEIEIYPQFEEGLEGIENYSQIEVIFLFHHSKTRPLKVIPPHDNKERGVFASRAPVRPNPIGLTRMELLKRKGRFLKVKNIDIVDGTPILDIKPVTD